MGEDEHEPEPWRDVRGIGERPGMNQNPLAPSFRDGPRTAPASTGSLLLGAAPVVVVALGVLVFAFLR